MLGMKKRGFGKGKWNGLGGKVKEGETIEEAAIREFEEECGVRVKSAEKMAELDFYFQSSRKEWNQRVHVFLAKGWDGDPVETEEMRPDWFLPDELPFHSMWQDDPHWLPLVLEGKKVKARFVFGEDNESIIEKGVKGAHSADVMYMPR
jgi:8-oxo-dGTP pyrophosphatase MutT (NUDIX family)